MTDDSELLKKRLRELALRAHHGGRTCFTRFLDPAEQTLVRHAASQAGAEVALWGGYDGAERCIAAFYSYEPPETSDYPIVSVALDWNAKYAHPAHRDLLGAVMGLGLERDSTGDIAFAEGEGRAVLFAHRDVSACICMNLESAGRATIRATESEQPIPIREPEGTQLRVTVAAPRMDAVIAAAWHLSRSEAQRLIGSGLVKRNHLPELRSDIHLQDGDLLSVRGHGRLRVREELGLTKKGRSALQLFLYKS